MKQKRIKTHAHTHAHLVGGGLNVCCNGVSLARPNENINIHTHVYARTRTQIHICTQTRFEFAYTDANMLTRTHTPCRWWSLCL